MMDAREREVLQEMRFVAVPTERTLWGGDLPHVDGFNQPVYDRVRRELVALRRGMVDSPPGIVVHGEYGSGKSHLVWWARRLVAGLGGYFFNIQPDGHIDTLWTRMLTSIVRDLQYPIDPRADSDASELTQLTRLLTKLAKEFGLSQATREALTGNRMPPARLREHLKEFTDAIRTRRSSRELRNAALALALLAVHDDDANLAASEYLRGSDEELSLRREWGLLPTKPGPPDELVRHLSDLIALTGPSLFVVDQIDDLVVRSTDSTEAAQSPGQDDLAAGLMTLREKLARSLMLISCLDHTWDVVLKHSTRSAHDRFHDALHLQPVPSAEVAHRLVAKYLANEFERIGFAPPYDSWPIPPQAFDRTAGFRPRQLIQMVGKYVAASLEADEMPPLTDLSTFADRTSETNDQPHTDQAQERYLDHFRSITVDSLKETRAEKDLADVLTASVRALVVERGLNDSHQVRDTCRGADRASTHCEVMTASGRRIYIRGVNTVSAAAIGSRLDNARGVVKASGDDAHLLIAHTNAWNPTDRVRAARDAVESMDGVIIELDDNELRTLWAVKLTSADDSPESRNWLRHRKPVSDTKLGAALMEKIDPPEPVSDHDSVASEVGGENHDEISPVFAPHLDADAIPLGRSGDDQPLALPLHDLRRHMAVLAASGSGKTVLLRRIIEECALRGVSTIVLDTNNDLARLGDSWPVPPQGWWPGDEARAADYLASTDVVVWTPGVSRGNPLTLQPFPDFTAVADDPDELRLAVDTTVAALAPRARIDGENHVADGRRAILRETLMTFAGDGGGDLSRLIDLLSDPPAEVLALPSAAKHAGFVAEALSYARLNDALFDGEGTPFDPDRLLTPAPDRRARVSIINLAAIPDENRPAFVNRLQMTLFSWIKRNPARDKPLSGLFIMDEAQNFIPSGKTTPCTESTRNLASQARKYGLGLVYATQAPRGIDSRIIGNAASHVYGRVTIPSHVGAVKEMARARGEEPPAISGLTPGRFFISLEGHPMTETTVPMCLSHDGAPLDEAEILQRAWR